MASKNIRVLIVDDSVLIRQIIRDYVSDAPGMEVVGVAADGHKALDLCESTRPDVVTLDIQMPGMDGLATLDALLAKRPVPVIMVSSLTRAGATVTMDALECGALDYVAKPDRGSKTATALGDELLRKIRSVYGSDVQRILRIREQRNKRLAQPRPSRPVIDRSADTPVKELADKCIAIGISTGGPPALSSLFETLRPPVPPIVVVQHMPSAFTGPFSWRLNSVSQLSIKEAANGDMLRPNHVYVAPGGKHLSLRPQGRSARIMLATGEPVSGHKPSADVMMQSAAQIYGPRCLGVIMTGMGHDGADGCRAIRAKGGFVLGQDAASSDVYGMNKVAYVEGNVNRQFGLSKAAAVIRQQVAQMTTAVATA